MNRGAWWATDYVVEKSQTQLSDEQFHSFNLIRWVGKCSFRFDFLEEILLEIVLNLLKYLGVISSCHLFLFSCSVVWVFATLRTAASQASLSFTIDWVCSNLCPLSQWCHLIITSSLALFSFCPQSFLASESFPKSSVFPQRVSSLHPVDQSIRASASASVRPMNIQGWFSLGLTGLIYLLSRGLSIVFSSNTIQKYQFFGTQSSSWSNSHMTAGKTIALTIWTCVGNVMSLLYNMLSFS